MVLNAKSKYPSRRTYVLKLRGDAHPGALAGRLENLVTGGQHEFESGRQMLEWIASDLHASTEDPPADATESGAYNHHANKEEGPL